MKKLSFLTLILLTLFACRKNIEDDVMTTVVTTPADTTTIDYEPEVVEVIATLFGEVYDEAGSAVSNASVTLEGNNTNTDDKGRFVFKDITMNQLGTYVEVNKNGYFPGSNRFFPEEGSVNYVKITLLDKSNIGNFPGSEGALISSPEGISIDFPANAVVSPNGDTYNGTVQVAARWIDPTAVNLQEIMPGGLQGIMPGGVQGNSEDYEEVALASFGMMAVELEGSNGEVLNLGNGEKATLSFPVPASLLNNAPAEIPLWYFSDEFGVWVIDGSAALEGDKYVGEVGHFSFWNCDAPFDLAKVCGSILSSAGNPFENSYIKITVLSSGIASSGWTNSDGEFSGKVPANELLEMEVYESWYCSGAILTESLGPFPVNTDTTYCENLGAFTLPASTEEVNITATVVDCSGSPVTNGWIEINLDNTIYSNYIDNGNVSMTLLNCNNQTELTALASNIDDLMMGVETTYTISNPLDLGTISACGTVITEWIIVNIDGDSTIFTDTDISYDFADSLWFGANPGAGLGDIFLSLEGVTGPAPITLDTDDLNYISFNINAPSGGVYNSSCGNPVFTVCDYSFMEISELGSSGEPIIGEVSGVIDVLDTGTNTTEPRNVIITFNILRE